MENKKKSYSHRLLPQRFIFVISIFFQILYIFSVRLVFPSSEVEYFFQHFLSLSGCALRQTFIAMVLSSQTCFIVIPAGPQNGRSLLFNLVGSGPVELDACNRIKEKTSSASISVVQGLAQLQIYGPEVQIPARAVGGQPTKLFLLPFGLFDKWVLEKTWGKQTVVTRI